MGKVSIVRTGVGIKQALSEALDLIGGFGTYVRHDDLVLLKPNLNGVEGFTKRKLVEALIQLLFDFGVGKVVIGESTFGDAHMTDVFFNKTGYTDLACQYNVKLINLNRSQVVEAKVEYPLALETIRVAQEVYEADKIINLPNMKVHYATGISLALKNMKGILVGDEKKHFHEAGLDKAIVDLNNTIRPALNIVDAIACMERMGPRGGDIVNLELLLAGGSSAEVDYVGSQIMGYSLDEVKHLEQYVAVNGIDLSQVEVVGESIEKTRYPFKKVNLDILLPEVFHLHTKEACSSCENAFLLSCQVLENQPSRIIDVYMGKWLAGNEAAGDLKIGFGSCVPGDAGFDKVIKGCPPYPYALRGYLQSAGVV